MSVEFRPRKPSEFANILLKRKWLILFPTIAIGLAIAYVVFRLPDVYESVTLIVVKPSTLPNSVVPTITEETLTRELTIVQREIQLGRTPGEALREMSQRTDLEEVRGLAAVIIQADRSWKSTTSIMKSACAVSRWNC